MKPISAKLYIVATCDEVSKYLSKGWMLYGNPIECNTIIYQALIHYSESPNE